MTLTATLNAFGLTFQTIAMQNERPGFVTLVGYVGLVYAFVGDVLIFGESFTWVEIVCALVILSFNVTVIVFNLK
jgi:drug/metabolite transporter (DMT)-like permease